MPAAATALRHPLRRAPGVGPGAGSGCRRPMRLIGRTLDGHDLADVALVTLAEHLLLAVGLPLRRGAVGEALDARPVQELRTVPRAPDDHDEQGHAASSPDRMSWVTFVPASVGLALSTGIVLRWRLTGRRTPG